MKFSFTALLWLLRPDVAVVVSGRSYTLTVHGSGGTNPSNCIWAIMEQFEKRSKNPIQLSFRGIGTTSGLEEFINTYKAQPANDFATGEVPLNKTVYDQLNQNGIEVVHLPILLGAVSFFHSAPVQKLNMTSCLLAKIFQRKIKTWDDDSIVAINPEFRNVKNLPPLTVARRVLGSSSTYSITNYFRMTCPDEWPEKLTGSVIDWPEDTEKCEGSVAMSQCIENIPGAIGYVDSGHAWSVGLKEVELANKAGTRQNSWNAAQKGGISAAEVGVLPNRADQDHSQVSFLNRDGKYTWPIVQMTYFYLRKDLSYLRDANEQSLLVAYLKAFYSDTYVKQCADKYGFTIPSIWGRDYALDGVSLLQVDPNATTWIFEDTAMPIIGARDFVISANRQLISDLERATLALNLADLQTQNKQLQNQLSSINESGGMSDSQNSQLTASLVLSSLSFVLVCLSIIVQVRLWLGDHRPSQPVINAMRVDHANGLKNSPIANATNVRKSSLQC